MPELISKHCPSLPAELAKHIDTEFSKIQEHYLLGEWNDLQIDAGRLSEAVLRLLEFKLGLNYTPINGRSKPNRKHITNAARNNTTLSPTLRLQIPDTMELIMDFRNNRNAAHLGDIDSSHIDGMTVYQLVLWIIGEIVRLESNLPATKVKSLLTAFAEKPVPIIYRVNGRPIVLDTNLSAKDIVLVLLYDANEAVPDCDLFKWSKYTNISNWRRLVIKPLEKNKMIHIENGVIYLLPPGNRRVQQIVGQG